MLSEFLIINFTGKSCACFLKEKDRLRYSGLDLNLGVVRDNLAAGVVEPAISKIKSLRFATEAAISILRIDDMIKLNPAREEKQHRH